MANEIQPEDLKLVMTVDPDVAAVDAALLKMGKTVDEIATGGEAKITAEMRHQNELLKLRAQLEPQALADSVRRYREILDLQNKIADAKMRELHEQQRPGFFQKLVEDPGKAFADMKGKAGGFFKEMSGELGKGGMGGVIDKLLGGGGGGKGGAGATNMLLGGVLGGQNAGGMGGQLGGMLGEAIGGPAGALVGETVGKYAVKALTTLIAGPANLAVSGLTAVSRGLKSLDGELGPVGLGFDMLTGGVESLGGAVKSIPIIGDLLGPAVDALTMVPGILKSITTTLTGFAGKASPATIRQFQIAVEDVQGVIGQRFIPVLNLMREGVRAFGDFLATVLPTMDEVNGDLAALRSSWNELKDTFRGASEELGPLVKGLLRAEFKLLAFEASMVVKQLTLLTNSLSIFRGVAAGVNMLMGNNATPAQSSSGAAARSASFQGIEEYQRSLQLAAFSEPGQVTQAQVPGLMFSMNEHLRIIASWALSPSAIAAAVRDSATLPATQTGSLAVSAWMGPAAPVVQAAASVFSGS